MSKNSSPLQNKKFSFSDIPDQSGKIIIITGANRGLGFIASRELSSKNATVILACRNTEEGEKARKKILFLNLSKNIQNWMYC